MEQGEKVLKHSKIPIVKVRWNSRHGPEFTWERKDQMKLKYPQLFPEPEPEPVVTPASDNTNWISGRDSFQLGDNVTSHTLSGYYLT